MYKITPGVFLYILVEPPIRACKVAFPTMLR